MVGGRRLRRYWLITAFISGSVLMLLVPPSRKIGGYYNSYLSSPESEEVAEVEESAVDAKCVIPYIEPMALNLTALKPMKCGSVYPANPIKITDDGFVDVDSSYWVGNSSAVINCFYREIVSNGDFEVVVRNDQIPLPPGRSVCPCDVFIATCANNELATLFETAFRCIRPRQLNSYKNSHSSSLKLFDEKLNIVIFGLDSVSGIGFAEQMRKTTRVVNEILGGITFEGYNIVGDGTTAAVLGFTSGYLEEELHNARRGVKDATTVDDFPFIWRQLQDVGYATLWDEDCAWCATFHYRLKGFAKPPVHHYGRPFQLAVENKLNFSKGDSNSECLGSVSRFQEMLTQFRRFFAAYPDPIPKFAQVMNQYYTHNSGFIGNGDVDNLVASEMLHLNKMNYLNNTALILLSDHGPRFSDARATFRGKVAERLPYLSIVLPKWFREKYPENIRYMREVAENRKLVTPFDLHATLLDLGGLEPFEGTPARGISFFKPIPNNRTCEEAGVQPHWCTCLIAEENSIKPRLSSSDVLVVRSMAVFENYVNKDLLANFSDECHPIKIDTVSSAMLLGLKNEVLRFERTIINGQYPLLSKTVNKKIVKYNYIHVSFWTKPANARWEATFQHDTATGEIILPNKQISRTNSYANAPACVQKEHPHLRQFCVCKAFTDNN